MAGSLTDLRDIHLPQPISWWPPAPGWWLLLSLLLLLVLAAVFVSRRRKQGRYRRAALSRLDLLKTSYRSDGDGRKLLRELSQLLRQAAVCHFPREDCAGLVGDDWLAFLDQGFKDAPFSSGVGRVLASAPYAPVPADFEAEQLTELCRRWMQQLPSGTPVRGGER
ncbi:MAG: DUF4381 domain-containing protein [Desulfuromonas sp.]|nr:MAG: DUF4381 domain-containing protein [Desulfuromonas sp.]